MLIVHTIWSKSDYEELFGGLFERCLLALRLWHQFKLEVVAE